MKNYIQIKNSLAQVSEDQQLKITLPLNYKNNTNNKTFRNFMEDLSQWQGYQKKQIQPKVKLKNPNQTNFNFIVQQQSMLRYSLPKLRSQKKQNYYYQPNIKSKHPSYLNLQNPQYNEFMYNEQVLMKKMSLYTNSGNMINNKKKQNENKQKLNMICIKLPNQYKTKKLDIIQQKYKKQWIKNIESGYRLNTDLTKKLQKMRIKRLQGYKNNRLLKMTNSNLDIPIISNDLKTEKKNIDQQTFHHKNILLKFHYKGGRTKRQNNIESEFICINSRLKQSQ